ncbi:diacylglycerol/lipid kinase family protein [Flavobacterium suzhouense]|uniref:Diacylglycerol/lipid kinase family protein n=1 Tax=Flavobacterium suzhouense TaxID=1529638 RepID=A0ABW5NXF8_9FLAO
MVVNPISGGNDKTELIDTATHYLKERGVELVMFETTGNDDEKAIHQLYEEHKPERILVAGGDGTIKIVAEAVEKHDVVIGVLPAGSANGLSVDLKLSVDIKENLDIAFGDSVMEMDMVSINGKKSLHLSDIGANAELIRNYENSSLRGKLGYGLQALNTLTELDDPFEVTIHANGVTLTTEARMVVIANTQKYGTGVTINPVGIMDDGKFEIVILKSLNIFLIGKILTGNMPVDADEDVEIISTDNALITTNRAVSFQIDGEYCGEEERLEIEVLHRQMRVAVP